MIIVRDTFQAKYGKGDELVALMKELKQLSPTLKSHRILVDASGPFFTIVSEMETGSLADWEKMAEAEFANPKFGAWFQRMTPPVDSGRRDFYTVVA